MKKTLLALSASAAMIASVAADSCHSWTGAYVGIQGGMANLSQKAESTGSGTGVNVIADKSNLGKTGYHAAVNFGYIMQFNPNFAAFAEGFIGKDGVDSESKHRNGDETFTQKSNKKKLVYGLSVNPALVLNQTSLLFVKLGYEFGKNEFKVSNQDHAANGQTKENKGSKKGSFVLGFGLKTLVTRNIILGLGVDHVFLRKQSVTVDQANVANAKISHKLKGHMNRFLVSVAYKF
jgi:opacity protein-like surface antigen